MRKYILAIDASTTAVGWALFTDDEYQESGVYKLHTDRDAWWRIFEYEQFLGRKIFMVDIVAYELATGNRGNMRTNRLMGGLEYVTRNCTRIDGIDLITVTASQVRASGCHKKALTVASAIAGKKIKSGDEADAIGVALAALGKIKVERS